MYISTVEIHRELTLEKPEKKLIQDEQVIL